MPETPQPSPEDAKIGDHPMSSFNLNAHGENPDFEDEDAPDLQPSEELKTELADYKQVSEPETGQDFGFLELNRQAEGRPIINLLQYSIDLEHPGTKYELEQIATQSGRHVLSFENPGTGTSDKLTPEQRQGVKEGDFGPIADSILRVIQERGLTEVDLEGSSLGARLALAIAARASEHGVNVKNVVAIEVAGLSEMSFGQLVNRFAGKEGANMKTYSKYIQDPRGKESMDSNLDVVKNFAKLIKRDARGNLLAYPKGLGQATALADMVSALETQPDMKLHLLSGGVSEIARRDDVNTAYNELSQTYGDRVHMIRLPGDTHSVGIGAARRIGWHVSRLVNN